MNTIDQYQAILSACKDVYLKKAADYGTSWRIYRTISIVDQIYIKAWRIRQIQETGIQKISDSVDSEFMAIVNYGLMALIQSTLAEGTRIDLSLAEAERYYLEQETVVRELMLQKNHDYGEAWKELSQQSFVDLILTKLLRIKQILANEGKTLVSEGMDANFCDIVNYAVFALIQLRYPAPK